MIDDPELRALFKAESEEHLQTLENGLLRLEAEPRDTAMLEELFRSAHSLKGAARMLGVADVETLAHHFEDELGAARRGHNVLTSAAADRLYHGLDAMRKFAREATEGEAANVNMAEVLAQLRGDDQSTTFAPMDGKPGNSATETAAATTPAPFNPAPSLVPIVPEFENISVLPKSQNNGNAQEPPGTARPDTAALSTQPTANGRQAVAIMERPAVRDSSGALNDSPGAVDDSLTIPDGEQSLVSPATFKIDTIRVEPQKLDALMTMAGEMAVTTTRVARALALIGDLTVLREEWDRDVSAWQSAPAPLPDGLAHHSRHSQQEQIAQFHERETGRLERLGHLLVQLAKTSDEGITRLGLVSGAMDTAIRDMRLLPFSTIFSLFPRMARDLSHEQGKEVRLVIEGGSIAADKHLLEEMKDPLMHLLRNAIDHGIETPEEREQQGKPREATLRLCARQTAAHVIIEISDDGRGLDVEAIRRIAQKKGMGSAGEIAAMPVEDAQRLIFAPGFSTSPLITNVSGRGVGLDVVRINIERLKGTIAVESVPGHGCNFRLQAPITLATTRVLLAQVAQQSYALPLEAVQDISLVSPRDIFYMEGRPTIRRDNRPISVAYLADLLELPDAADTAGKANRQPVAPERSLLPCILLAIGADKLGLFVDALLDEQEVIVKPFGGLLQRVRNLIGATILNTGEICMALNPQDLMESARKQRTVRTEAKPVEAAERKKVVLLAEDSITTRTQEKRILESGGYEVVTAVDGADAFGKLGTRNFDAVVSDVEMPNMDGLTFAARIRQNPKYAELPIILVTSLASDEDRKRGIEVGANAYITKGAFEQAALLDTLRRLI